MMRGCTIVSLTRPLLVETRILEPPRLPELEERLGVQEFLERRLCTPCECHGLLPEKVANLIADWEREEGERQRELEQTCGGLLNDSVRVSLLHLLVRQ